MNVLKGQSIPNRPKRAAHEIQKKIGNLAQISKMINNKYLPFKEESSSLLPYSLSAAMVQSFEVGNSTERRVLGRFDMD